MAVIDLQGYAVKARAAMQAQFAGKRAKRSVLETSETFYDTRDAKYIEDIFNQAGVAMTGDTTSVPINVEGYDTFVIEFEGTMDPAGTIDVEAILRPNKTTWALMAQVVDAPGIQAFVGFYRRMRLVYRHQAGSTITKVNMLIVKA